MFRPSRKQKGGDYGDLYTFDQNPNLYEPALNQGFIGSFTLADTLRNTINGSANTGKIFLTFHPTDGTSWSQVSELRISQTSTEPDLVLNKLQGLTLFAQKNPNSTLFLFLQSVKNPEESNILLKYAVPYQEDSGNTFAFTGLVGQVATSTGLPVANETYRLFWRVPTDSAVGQSTTVMGLEQVSTISSVFYISTPLTIQTLSTTYGLQAQYAINQAGILTKQRQIRDNVSTIESKENFNRQLNADLPRAIYNEIQYNTNRVISTHAAAEATSTFSSLSSIYSTFLNDYLHNASIYSSYISTAEVSTLQIQQEISILDIAISTEQESFSTLFSSFISTLNYRDQIEYELLQTYTNSSTLSSQLQLNIYIAEVASTIAGDTQRQYDSNEQIIQVRQSTQSGLTTQLANLRTQQSISSGQLDDLTPDWQAAKSKLAIAENIQNYYRAIVTEISTAGVYNSSAALVAEIDQIYEMFKNGYDVANLMVRSTFGVQSGGNLDPITRTLTLAETQFLNNLVTTYTSISSLLPTLYEKNILATKERENAEILVVQKESIILKETLQSYDILIQNLLNDYKETLEDISEAKSEELSTNIELSEKSKHIILSTSIIGIFTSNLNAYTTQMADYMTQIDSKTNEYIVIEREVLQLNNQLEFAEATRTQGEATIESMRLDKKDILDEVSSLQQREKIVGETLARWDTLVPIERTELLEMQKIKLNALGEFATISQSKNNQYLETQYNQYMLHLNNIYKISSFILSDYVNKLYEIAESKLGGFTDADTRIQTLNSKKNTIEKFQPAIEDMRTAFVNEMALITGYGSDIATYEIQSKMQQMPGFDESEMTYDEFESLKLRLDLTIQSINNSINKRIALKRTIDQGIEELKIKGVIPEQIYGNLTMPITSDSKTLEPLIPFKMDISYIRSRVTPFLPGGLATTTLPTCDTDLTIRDDTTRTRAEENLPATTTLDTTPCGVSGRYIRISKPDNDLEILQLIVINKYGKNMAFQRPVTLMPHMLNTTNALSKQFITNGTYSVDALITNTLASGSQNFYTYIFTSPANLFDNISSSPKLANITLDEIKDTTSIQYLRIRSEYDCKALEVEVLDADMQPLITRTLWPIDKESDSFSPPKLETIALGEIIDTKSIQHLRISSEYNCKDLEIAVLDADMNEIMTWSLWPNDVSNSVSPSPQKQVFVDLGATIDITAIQYLKFSSDYDCRGLEITVLDSGLNEVTKKSLLLNVMSQTIDLRRDSTDPEIYKKCAVSINPQREGTCGYMTRYVRLTMPDILPSGFQIHMSQIVVVGTNGENIALGRAVSCTFNSNTSMLVDGHYYARPLNECFKGVVSSTTDYIEIDLGFEQDVAAVHIYNTSEDKLKTQDMLRIQTLTEDRQSILIKPILNTFAKEVVDFRHSLAQKGCSTNLRWPTFYGEAGILCKAVQLRTDGNLEFSNIEIVDKVGYNVAQFAPVTITNGVEAEKRRGVSVNRSVLPRAQAYSSTTPGRKTYLVDLTKQREITAVRVYGITEAYTLGGIWIDFFAEIGNEIPLISFKLNGTSAIEYIDTRYDPEDSKFPVTVTQDLNRSGMQGTFAQTVIFDRSVTNIIICEATGKQVPVKSTKMNGQNMEVSLPRMYEITGVSFVGTVGTAVQLKDCYNMLVNEWTEASPADFRSPNVTPYLRSRTPLVPLPIRYGTTGGVKTRYVKIYPATKGKRLYISQIVVVDSTGRNIAFEKDAFTRDVARLADLPRPLDGNYEIRFDEPDFSIVGFTNYKTRPLNECFVSKDTSTEPNYDPDNFSYAIDLGAVFDVNSVIIVVADGSDPVTRKRFRQDMEGSVVELLDDVAANAQGMPQTVGVSCVTSMLTAFGNDIIDFRRDITDDTNRDGYRIEVKQRSVQLGPRQCGILSQYVRLHNRTPSKPMGISQLFVLDSDGQNIALYKPTFSPTNQTSSFKVVDGRYFLKGIETGFKSPGNNSSDYIEVNLGTKPDGTEYEITKIYYTELLPAVDNSIEVRVYNKERDLILTSRTDVTPQFEDIQVSNDTTYRRLSTIGVKVRNRLIPSKFSAGLLPAIAMFSTFLNEPDVQDMAVLRDPMPCRDTISLESLFTRGSGGGIPARYVRVYNINQYIQISQLMVYNEAGDNVAYKKPATATDTLPDRYATYATDGAGGFFHRARSEDAGGGKIFISSKKRYDYWEVDLESIQSIIGVRYIPPSSRMSRNRGTRIQLLNTDKVVLAEGIITDIGERLLDFRIPSPMLTSLNSIIMPKITSLPAPASAFMGAVGLSFRADTKQLIIADIQQTKRFIYNLSSLPPSALIQDTTQNLTTVIISNNTNIFSFAFRNTNNLTITNLNFTGVTSFSGLDSIYSAELIGTSVYAVENKQGAKIWKFTGTTPAVLAIPGQLNTLLGITGYVSTAGTVIYFSRGDTRKVYKYIEGSNTPPTVIFSDTNATDPISELKAPLSMPCGLSYDSLNNVLFVADFLGNRIYAILQERTVVRLAGTGEAGFTGDGDQAINARLDGPFGLKYVEEYGNLYISDYKNKRIRVISLGSSPPATISPTTTNSQLFATTTVPATTDETAAQIDLTVKQEIVPNVIEDVRIQSRIEDIVVNGFIAQYIELRTTIVGKPLIITQLGIFDVYGQNLSRSTETSRTCTNQSIYTNINGRNTETVLSSSNPLDSIETVYNDSSSIIYIATGTTAGLFYKVNLGSEKELARIVYVVGSDNNTTTAHSHGLEINFFTAANTLIKTYKLDGTIPGLDGSLPRIDIDLSI